MTIWKDLIYEVKISGFAGTEIHEILRQSVMFCMEKNIEAEVEINQIKYKINVSDILQYIQIKE